MCLGVLLLALCENAYAWLGVCLLACLHSCLPAPLPAFAVQPCAHM